MKKIIAAMALFVCGSVQAACPDITGKWGGLFESVSYGEKAASVGRFTIKSDGTFKGSSTGSYIGFRVTQTETYTYDYNTRTCKIFLTTPTGIFDGIAVSKNKILFIGSSPNEELTQTGYLERIR